MKVLLDCSLLKVGGALQVGLGVLEGASKTPSIEWHVICTKNLKSQLHPVIKKKIKSFVLINLSNFSKILPLGIYSSIEKKVNPDIVFSVFGPSYWLAKAPHLQGFAIPALIYPNTKYPRQHDFLSEIYSRFLNSLKKIRLKKADYLIVETETVKKRLIQNFRIKSKNIYVVKNSYSSIFEKRIRELKPVSKNKIFRIFVPASYYPHKNLEIIPEVAFELKKRTQMPFEFVLTLPKEEFGWKKILKISKKLKVSTYIQTLGSVSHMDIAEVYKNSNAVFLPTLLECSTAVYPESFMARLPVVTSGLDFSRELCRNAALYFDPYSPSSAANKLHSLMSRPKLRSKLIKFGCAVLKQNYPTPKEKWNGYISCLNEIFEKEKLNQSKPTR